MAHPACSVLVVGGVLLIFSLLTVEVDGTEVRASFGAGWPRRSAKLAEVASARVVRNRSWYGWGIRWIPGGSLWNVSGLDAVELRLRSGRAWRVGSDEPDELLTAIRLRIG